MVQIFVQVEGSKVITREVELPDKVSDVVKRIPTSASYRRRARDVRGESAQKK